MTNQLFRDYLDGKIPGHDTPTTTTVTLTISLNGWPTITYGGRRSGKSAAFERLRKILVDSGAWDWAGTFAEPINWAAQRGITGLDAAHFNDAVKKLARTTKWSHEDAAEQLGHVMEVVARMELEKAGRVDRDVTVAKAPRHGPPPSASWRGRGRVTKYARG